MERMESTSKQPRIGNLDETNTSMEQAAAAGDAARAAVQEEHLPGAGARGAEDEPAGLHGSKTYPSLKIIIYFLGDRGNLTIRAPAYVQHRSQAADDDAEGSDL